MVYALVGPNTYQLRADLNKLKDEFITKHGHDGVEQYRGEDLTSEVFQSITGGVSLFVSQRLIIIRNLSDNKVLAERFTEIMHDVPEETTIAIIEGSLDKRTTYYKALKKLKHFHEYNEPDEKTLMQWVKQVVADEQATITPDGLRALLTAVGADQSRLANELTKLTAYDKKITAQTVNELVEPNPQDSVFMLLDAALSGKQVKAQALLTNLERAHEDPYQIVNMLIWQVHILAVVASAEGVPEAEIAKKAKINPYVVKKTATLARNLSKHKIQQIVDTVAKLDIALKTSAAQPWPLLTQTLIMMHGE